MILERIQKDATSGSTDSKLEDMVRIRNRPLQARKLIKAASGATAAIAVAPNFIDISAPTGPDGQPTGLSVIGSVGTVIRGRLGLTASPGEIRIGGLWVLNDFLLSAAPSTIMTPIPVLRFSPPLEEVALHMTNLTVIAALLGAS